MQHLKSLIVLKPLKILTIFFVISCQNNHVKFDPDVYVGDASNSQIINEDGLVISAESEEFNNFGCMHIDKWKELRELLKKARMPRWLKEKSELELDKVESAIVD